MDERRKLSALQRVAQAQRRRQIRADAALAAAVRHETSQRERAARAQQRHDEMLSYWAASMRTRALDPHLIAGLADAVARSDDALARARQERDQAGAEVSARRLDHAHANARAQQTLRTLHKLNRRHAHRAEERAGVESELRATRRAMTP